MIGLANCPNGYHADDARYLEPMLTTCAGLITAYRTEAARLEAERRLAESKNQLGFLIHHLKKGVMVANGEGQVIYTNASIGKVLGIDHCAAQCEGEDVPELLKDWSVGLAEPAGFSTFMTETWLAQESVFNQEFALARGGSVSCDMFPVLVEEAHHGYLWTFREV